MGLANRPPSTSRADCAGQTHNQLAAERTIARPAANIHSSKYRTTGKQHRRVVHSLLRNVRAAERRNKSVDNLVTR